MKTILKASFIIELLAAQIQVKCILVAKNSSN